MVLKALGWGSGVKPDPSAALLLWHRGVWRCLRKLGKGRLRNGAKGAAAFTAPCLWFLEEWELGSGGAGAGLMNMSYGRPTCFLVALSLLLQLTSGMGSGEEAVLTGLETGIQG